MNRILYITRHNPFGQGGGSVASHMYLEAFRKVFKSHIIDLCLSDCINPKSIPNDISNDKNINLIFVNHRSKISKLLSPITQITHRYQAIAKNLLKSNQYSHCIFDHSSIAGTIIKYVPTTVKTVVIHHNYEPDYFKDNTTNPILRSLLLPSVRYCEKIAYKKCSVNLFLTNEDANLFIQVYGETNSLNLTTGLFEPSNFDNIKPVSSLKKNIPTIVITGSLDNIQNTDGIKYFINYLYPHIPKNFKIIISGKNPNHEILELVNGLSNIELIPNPFDMSDVICRGNIYLSPARIGGGIKVRVTDGLKHGLPILAHEVSARGYKPYIEHGYFNTFSNPDEFEQKLKCIIYDIDNMKYSPIEIANFYQQNSNLNVIVDKLKKLL